MNANVEDKGIKGDCTPLMEAASAGHVDIVSLLIAHGADVNAQSSSGNTPLMYGCAGGHEEVVKVLLEAGANVEDHNENGHTPLMEAASAGHVSVAKVLLEHGAGINTHSNEFKESALTLACYKGHLDMVRFLLSAGADQEHKTDEMHTALMEASMDGHVEVARLLLDSGAQVNMPTDSFESPLTLAACGGHVDLAMLLIERGANIEEVNDEGYTPLMEAAREGHEEMVALLLSQGANINAQTEETQETALTLACCGGFIEVADFLIKAGADIELGASTPLMEAAQEGHLDLVRYLLESNANVQAQTQTSDTALTYACENGHTDVVDILLQFGADLEHESEGGRTPLMKACRAGHLCTVQFLVSKKADVNRQTTNNDHTPLSLACAGGHLSVVELLLAQSADPFHKLKDNSTMLIEAAKGGHTNVVQLLLDYPHSIMINSSRDTSQSMLINSPQIIRQPLQISTQYLLEQQSLSSIQESVLSPKIPPKNYNQKSILRKTRSIPNFTDAIISSAELQHICQSITSNTNSNISEKNAVSQTCFPQRNDYVRASSSLQVPVDFNNQENDKSSRHEQIVHKQQILEELQKVERELQINGVDHLCSGKSVSCNDDVDLSCTNQINQVSSSSDIDSTLNIHEEEVHHTSAIQCSDSMEIIKPSIVETANYQNASSITSALSFYKGFQQANKYYIEGFKEGIKLEKQRMLKEVRNLQETQLPLPLTSFENFPITTNDFLNTSSISLITVPASTGSISSIIPNSPCMSNLESTFNSDSLASTEEICGTSQPIISSLNVSQSTAINDRPKVKAVSKKDNKSVRKTVHGMVMNKLQQQHMALMAGLSSTDFQKFLEKTRPHCVQQVHHLQQLNQQLQLQLDQAQTGQTERLQEDADTIKLHLQGPCPFFIDSLKYPKTTVNDEIMELGDGSHVPIDEAVNIFDSISFDRMSNDDDDRVGLKRNGILRSEEQNLSQIMNKDNAKSRSIQEISSMTSLSTFNLTTTPSQNQTNSSTLIQTSACQPLQKQVLNAFEAGLSIGIQTRLSDDNKRTQLVLQSNQIAFAKQSISPTSRIDTMDSVLPSDIKYSLDSTCLINQVQAATQTQLPLSLNTSAPLPDRKSFINTANNIKGKKNKHILGHHCSTQQSSISSSVQIPLSLSSQNYPIDSSTVSNNHTTSNFVETYSSNQIPTTPFSCMDVDSETDSNHDTALTLACAGGHEELVELLLSRGADIEHRDKKGFTPLILAATAGHQKVVEILLNHGADLEAQSERTKDTPLSLACSGGRYEVVELLLNRAANKEHRNVSDYTPLSLAASGGYVNIIKLLLNHGAEINSRTGSKLGISPLMLAAMNGHTAAVKLLLDMGSDINAQIETNRNTALTLACFQGRHEVVSLLLDRKANVEHRAKTGLTPLMEAASGGYVEVGRVLLSKGADVNAMPVPSSRDTALTIAADKGHCRFVELLLSKGTQVEVKNKKGNSPLWLAANGGHLNVVDLLYHAGANIDSQDNRKVSCLMAAFRKGHIKIIKWMVNHVTQFPSDQEMTRYVATISDKDILERCQECIKIIRAAKETQAAKANKNATILLEELDMEKTREESKKAAAARRRERKKKKKLEKKEEKRKLHAENNKNEGIYKINDMSKTRIDGNGSYNEDYHLNVEQTRDNLNEHTTELNKNISITEETKDNNTFTNIIEHDDMSMREKKKEKKKKKFACSSFNVSINESNMSYVHVISTAGQYSPSTTEGCFTTYDIDKHPADRDDFEATGNELCTSQKGKRNNNQLEIDVSHSTPPKLLNSTSPKYLGKRDEGWKEVVRKGQIEDSAKFVNASFRSKKVSVPPNAISRVIGRGGSNINSIRAATGAHIEIEKQSKSIGERIITIKGSFEATKQAHILISALIKNPDIDIIQLLSKSKLSCSINTIFVEKPNSSITTPKMKFVSTKSTSGFSSTTSEHLTKSNQVTSFSPTSYVLPLRSSTTNRSSISRFTSANDKKVLIHSMTQSNTKTTMSYTSAIMTSGRSSKVLATNISQTFAEKLSEINTISTAIDYSNSFQFNQVLHNAVSTANPSVHVSSVQSTVASNLQMQSHDTSSNNLLDSDTILSLVPVFTASSSHSSEKFNCQSVSNNLMTMNSSNMIITTTNSFSSQLIKVPQTTSISVNSPSITSLNECQNTACSVPLEYSLFNDTFSKVTQQSMWGSKEFENQKNINFATIAGAKVSVNNPVMPSNKFIDSAPIEVDASKAPGYRGILTCSPTSNLSNNFSSLGNNSTGDDGSLSSDKIVIQAEHVQLVDFTNDGILCGASKPPVNLISVRPHLHHNKDDKNMTTATSFMKMTSCENMKSSENAVTSPKGNDISLMSCQSNLEADIFDLNDESSNFENQSSSSNLIKTVTSESQSNAQCISIQRHIRTNNPQTIMPSAIVTTTISMSRLNPRAPDFSSSLHLGNNQQMTMLSTSTSRPTVFPIMSAQPSTSVIHSSNLTMVGGFTYNKYQTPFLRPTNPHHWPFLATPNYTHQDQLISQANYSDHIIGISSPSSNLDTINHENSHLRTPVMSLVSTGPTQEISHVQIEDRKPRPIGTERTWKNYSIIGPGGDTDNINWIPSQEKTTDSWPGILPNTDTNQLFDSNATFNRVLPNETDSHKTAESSFQGNHFRN